MIKPTVGRVVWMRRPDYSGDVSQPEAAIVTYVHNDRMINVAGWNHAGSPFSHTSVPLLQDNDSAPRGNHAEWMPFQKGQAAAQDAAGKT